jgi:hypothetical protein
MKRFGCDFELLAALGILLLWGAAAQADLTIMPLGDSVTWGGAPGYDIVPGGYRTRLYTDLQNAGYSFTFVGTLTDNPSPVLTAAGQTHHEGHPGYGLNDIANNLDGGGFWFHKPAPPNIILLQGGGADISFQGANASTTARRMDKLIGQIVSDSPSSLLLVSNKIPFNGTLANFNQIVQDFDTQLRDVIVPKYQSMGYNVTFVDQYPNFVDANGNIIHIGPDGRLPDQIGYDLMGDTLAAALRQALPLPVLVM